MDAVLTSLTTAAPIGVAGVVLFILGLLVRSQTQDRSDYRTQLTEQATRNAAELTRVNAAHDAELAELRSEIQDQRKQIDDLNTRLDAERNLRRAAEDSAMGQLQQRQNPPPRWPQ